MKKNFLFSMLAVLLAGFWFGGASLATDSYGVKDWNDSYFNWFAVHEYHAQTWNMEIDENTNTITYSNLKLADEGSSASITKIGQLWMVFLADWDDAANLNLARITKYKNWNGAFSAAPETISNEGWRWQYAFWLWVTPDLVKEALTGNNWIIENTFTVSNNNNTDTTREYPVNIDVTNYTQYGASSYDNAYLRNRDFFTDVLSTTEVTKNINDIDYNYGDDNNPVLFQVVDGKVVIEDWKSALWGLGCWENEENQCSSDFWTYKVGIEGNTIKFYDIDLAYPHDGKNELNGRPEAEAWYYGVKIIVPEADTEWAWTIKIGNNTYTMSSIKDSDDWEHVFAYYWPHVTPAQVKTALSDTDGIITNIVTGTFNGIETVFTINIDVNNLKYTNVETDTVALEVVNWKVVVENWKQVINSIEFANVVKPVAWNQATTGGITVTDWITIKNAVWTEKLPYTRPVSVPVMMSVTSASTLQIASESTTTSEEFTWTFEEGKEYVLNVQYDYDDWYTGSSVTYKVNGADATDELEGDGDIASFKFTAEAKPAQSNISGWGGSRWWGSSNSNTSAKSDEKATDTAKADEQKADEAKADENKNEAPAAEETAAPTPMTEAQAVAKFGQEQIDAYKWAHDKGITTMDTVEDARLDQPLTRAELAKMMVVYMAKIAKKSPVVTGTVSYPDVKSEELGDLAGYIQLAYQFQIMGIDANGKPIDEFNPNGLVTRWEYATVFSRVLFGSLFNQEWEDFYSKHIAALNAAGILTNTDPTIQEMRGWVMLMMYRSSQNLEEIAKVAAEIWATDEEVEAGKKAAEILAEEEAKAETTTWDVAEAPIAEEQAEAATWDVAEVLAVEETASVEANTWEVAAEPSNN